jgi:hypothetical protein
MMSVARTHDVIEAAPAPGLRAGALRQKLDESIPKTPSGKTAQYTIDQEAARRARANIGKILAGCLPGESPEAEPLRRYFAHRSLSFKELKGVLQSALRFHPSLPYYDGDPRQIRRFPGLVCAIRRLDGQLITLHRTYLTVAAQKAQVASPRKMMPIPSGLRSKGGAIQLGQPTTGILGVAEGLETALSVFQVTGIPTWSTVNACLMRSVEIPENVHMILIWADKDESRTGQEAAAALKDRFKHQGKQVFVCLPRSPIPQTYQSLDWNDVLQQQKEPAFLKKMVRVLVISNVARRHPS